MTLLTMQILDKTSNLESTVRPWLRFWARMFDTVVYLLPGLFIAGIPVLTIEFCLKEVLPDFQIWEGVIDCFLSWLFLIFNTCLCEAIFLSTLGSTPGKKLFGIQIFAHDRGRPSFKAALKRSFKVMGQGLGFNVTGFSQFQQMQSYRHLLRVGITQWDEEMGFIIDYKKIGTLRKRIGLLIVIPIVVIYWILQFHK